MIYFIFNIISPIFRLEKVASPLFCINTNFAVINTAQSFSQCLTFRIFYLQKNGLN